MQVRTVLDTKPNAIAIPSEAVQRGPDGPYVWIVADNGTVQMHRIELGAIQEDRTVVRQGLTTGDRVVVAGQYRLTEGARVTEKDRSIAGQTQKSRS